MHLQVNMKDAKVDSKSKDNNYRVVARDKMCGSDSA